MSLAPDGLPPLREVIARHGLAAKKSLGQNFLLDLNLTARIARASGPLEGAEVIEVGPGPGGLTRALLSQGAARVVAIERDARCLDALAEIAAHYPGRLIVIEGDALEVDPRPHLTGPARIVANLPYNVGTELLVRWLTPPDWPPFWESLTLMFQREVAERIVAAPGSKAYGRLSVLAQWRATARIVFDVPPSAFVPPPKVTSSVVHLRPVEPRAAIDPKVLERVVAAAFSQRRKMLRQSLKALGRDPAPLLETAGIDPTRRAETLSIDEFLALARVAQSLG
ncbi:16S rRNA (adenine(1518)-N(6)/adenine(1519)-N(6))-dimethyltransferase RsmA [Limibaculum sp. FT325]|uniref:16S rRNA (adenine(1518)-N(6)/adenine(1519)-N(6))- dimethyltransferase RsmA n=1 Tax=Thermohalobaculum sediminis TaxID=2939436 RepID=UPI0020BF134A|nr:16S rRNA (adenine(1518)-N(6)/adenine(1519)-N(6))-dimethyltransferase RsmA [Limibaculum sediminis]MCL5777433.1 16S rRNA (adenine(1518)-N(6)/adenine(1519)-N(6))-dimethyltransferase RsmA [Limibaculum sediminis]